MKIFFAIVYLVCCSGLVVYGAINAMDIRARYDDVRGPRNSVVRVNTELGLGAGVRINKNTILSACHLFADDTNAEIVDLDKRKYPAVLVKCDRDSDVAILKSKEESPNFTKVTCSIMTPNSYYDYVIIGNPRNIPAVVRFGKIGNVEDGNYFVNAPVFEGDSGGGMFYKNELVGVISATLLARSNGFRPEISTYLHVGKIVSTNLICKNYGEWIK